MSNPENPQSPLATPIATARRPRDRRIKVHDCGDSAHREGQPTMTTFCLRVTVSLARNAEWTTTAAGSTAR